MRIVAALAIGALVGSCGFAVRHPAITAAIVGGVVAGATCEISTHNSSGGGGREGACAIVTGAAGVGLGAIVAAAIYFGGDGHTILIQDPPAEPEPPIHTFKHAPDAGVEVDAAEVDAAF